MTAAPRRSPALVIAFYAVIVGGTLLTTWLATRHPKTKAFHQGDFLPMAKVLEVLDAESVRVLWKGQEEILRFRGVRKPSAHPERLPAGTDAAAEDEIGRKALFTWIYRRPLKLNYEGDAVPREDDGRLVAYAELYGVDVGKKIVSEGRALAEPHEHPYREIYARFEAKARQGGRGIWRSR